MPRLTVRADSLLGRIAYRCGAPRIVRRFGNDEAGATAVEFSIVAAPFIVLVFATLEMALAFFAGQLLETAAADAARLIRTGQAQADGLDKDGFRDEVCELVMRLFDCEQLQLDVRVIETFDSVDNTVEYDEDGKLVVDDFGYSMGEAGDIVIVRVLYEWPVFVDRAFAQVGMDYSLRRLPSGKHLLSSTVAFKNEPFPW